MNLATLLLLGFVALVVRAYRRNYVGGLALAAFLLVSLPELIAINVSASLPSLTVHRAILLVCLVFWLREGGRIRELRGARFYGAQKWITLFFLVSTLICPYPLVGTKRFLYHLLESFALFCVVQTSVQGRDDARRVFRALGIGFLAVAALGFAERYAGVEVMDLMGDSRFGYGVERFAWMDGARDDVVSTYRHRILFGIACALGGLKFLIDGATAASAGASRKKLLAAFVCGCGLYFSHSRGPWLAFALAAAALAFVLPGRYLRLGLLLAVIVSGVFFVRPGVWSTVSGLGRATMDEESLKGGSYRWRFVVISRALEEISQSRGLHLLFGFGGGSHIMTDFGRVELQSGIRLPLQSWDSEWAITLYERGVVGFVAALYLYLTALAVLFVHLRRSPVVEPELAFCFAAILTLAVMMSNVSLYAPQLTYTAAFAFGASSRLLDTTEEQDEGEDGDDEGSVD